MQVYEAMAFGGHDKDAVRKNVDGGENDGEDQMPISQEDSLENSMITESNLDEVCSNNSAEKNDDFINSGDSLSSSASMSDSDLTSTDSEDSLALSESESITDVTPLNSPYCDSPLPHGKHVEHKTDDKAVSGPSRHTEADGPVIDYRRPEVNVLLKAIEKLELEVEKSENQDGVCGHGLRKRSLPTGEEAKRLEQENQRLFKRVISQQSRIKSMYPASSPPGQRNKHQELVKSDGDIAYCTNSVLLCLLLFSVKPMTSSYCILMEIPA